MSSVIKVASTTLSVLFVASGLAACSMAEVDDTLAEVHGEAKKVSICGSFAPDGTDKIETSADPASTNVCAPSGYVVDFYCVKAGTDTEIVYLDPPAPCVEVSAPNGKEVSHFSAHWIPIPETDEGGEWCSPGYWRNHLDSWPAGTHGTYYNDYSHLYAFDPKTIDSNPTLDEVLASPQVYGGPAFNNVGDLLSDLSGLDFDIGDPRNHNCPLN
jgi:hypothetical protein